MIFNGYATRRLYRFGFSSFLGVVFSLFALGGIASADSVTSITVDCQQVSVYLHNFPQSGVVVHITVAVGGQTPISSDVWATSSTSVAVVDVSPATLTLQGAPADVTVDVTWSLQGWHHVHETQIVTCGVPLVSSTVATTSTTQPPTTTSALQTTTSAPETTTSLVVLGATTVPGPTATTGVVAPTTTLAPQGSPLPTTPQSTANVSPTAAALRTGSGSGPLALFGLTAVASGALLALRRRGVWM